MTETFPHGAVIITAEATYSVYSAPEEPAPTGASCLITGATCDDCDDALCDCPDCVWIIGPLELVR